MKKNAIISIGVMLGILVVVIIALIVRNNSKKREENLNANTQNQVTEEFVTKLQDGTKLNNSSKLNETKKYKGLEISNIQLTNKNGQSLLLATVTNKSGISTQMQYIDLIIVDKNGKELGKAQAIIAPLEKDAQTQLSVYTMIDYINAYDFEIQETK